ncbi:MAG TPA: MmgE/PrpD family protein [Vicinamibacterales bacterium]|nr:MmgE/PrpD family protein [Vicinamibacterales bacterium]
MKPSKWTRRTLLRQTAALAAGGAWLRVRRVKAQAGPQVVSPPAGPAMRALSDYMSAALARPLPADVLEKAKQHVLDTCAAMISGAELAPGRAALGFAKAYGGPATATVVASPLRIGAIEAALVNGVLAHADETDDSHAPSVWHPGCAVVPAALAAGEHFGIEGAHFLRAVVLGYDVGSRVMATLRAAGPQTYKSSHSIAGVFGAAAAAGCAARLTPQQMHWLLDYTAQQSSGIAAWSRDTDHIEKAFAFGGMPARSGVTSALLVQAGWSGIDDIFSGENNFIVANAPGADPARVSLDLLVDRLGARYEVMRTNIKKWTVGSPIQAPLDALENLRARRPFSADDVRTMVVRVSGGDVVDNRDMPDISLQHMMAVMLLDGTASFRSAHDKPRMNDPVIVRHRAKVRLIANDPAITGRQAIVEVTLRDGTLLTEHVSAVRGTAENPMTRDEVTAKCRDLIVPVVGTAQWMRLSEQIFALDRLKSLTELRPLLQRE